MWFSTAWRWFNKYWMWLLPPIGALLYLIGRASTRKPPDVVAPELLEAEKKRREVQEEADRKAFEAERDRQVQLDKVRERHDKLIKDLTDEQREKAKELEEDPDKLNEFLLDVGRTVRG
jgi:hypothetical protein